MIERATGRQAAFLIYDEVGSVFERFRLAGLEGSLWRVTSGIRLSGVTGMDIAIIGSYEGGPNWRIAGSLTERCPVVVLASPARQTDAMQALTLGLHGYLDLDMDPGTLRRAMVAVMSGELAFSRDSLSAWLAMHRAPVSSRTSVLTPRQREIVELIAQGMSDKEIGGYLGISTATAQKHVTNILGRLRVPNRAAAVAASTRILV